MANVVADVVTTLQAATSLSAESVFPGFPQDSPDRGIWVVASGGLDAVQEAGAGGATYSQPRVRIFCRVSQRDHDELEALAEAARSAINRTPPSNYARCVPQGDVAELAPDDYGRHTAVFAALLTVSG